MGECNILTSIIFAFFCIYDKIILLFNQYKIKSYIEKRKSILQTFVHLWYNKKRRNDFILILIFLIAAILLFLWILKALQGGSSVTIEVAGKSYGTFRLNENRRIPITSSLGTNVIVIEDGFVYMEEADCKDGLCVKQGKKSYNGESIICLPHRVLVTVTGSSQSDVDSFVY